MEMAKHAKYVELVLKEEGMPSHFLAGYEIVSDYRSEGKRKLFLKRPESAIAEVKPKVRKRKARTMRPDAIVQANEYNKMKVDDEAYEKEVARG